jgi:hypothetical protein
MLFESGLKDLLKELPQAPSLEIGNKRDSPFITQLPREPGGNPKPARPKALSEHVDAKRLLGTHAITAPSTRHNSMLGLVGDGFFHFSRAQLRSLARLQYEQANPGPQSTLETHSAEFEKAHNGIQSQYPGRLSNAERGILRLLRNSSQKEAFVIVQNFARHAIATRKWGNDHRFPLSGLDLATRLGVEMKTAYRIRNKLIELGCIRKVEDCKPTVEADKFVWLLPLHDASRVSGD